MKKIATKSTQGSRTSGGAQSWQGALDDLLLCCPVVVSAPSVFFWAGEHTVLDGAVAVVQQVPLRVFVGLEPLGPARGLEPRLILDTAKPLKSRGMPYHVYRRDHLAFPCDFSAPQRETNLRMVAEVANLLFKDLCRLRGANTPIQRFRIRTASESRPGGGVNWSGAFSIALVTALLLTTNLQFLKQVTAWQENGVLHWGRRRLSDLVKESDSWFTRLHRWAWILEGTFHEGAGSGYGTLAAMAPSILPLAYRRAASDRYGVKFPRSVLKKNEQFHAISSATLYEHLKQWLGPDASNPIPYEAFAFRDVCLGPRVDEADVEWPLTYGLIDTWWPKSTGEMIRMATEEQDAALVMALKELEGRAMNPFGTTGRADRRCFGIGNCLQDRSASKRLITLSSRCTHLSLAGYSAIVCQRMKDVLRRRSLHAAESLVATVAQVHGGLEHLGLAWPGAHVVRGELVKVAPSLAVSLKTGVAAKLSGGGGGGCLLFAMVGRVSAEVIQNLEKRLKTCEYIVPDSPKPVSPTVLWHNGKLLTDEGKREAAAGVCIEVMNSEGESWGRFSSKLPLGKAILFPARGGRTIKTLRLTQISLDRHVVVAKIEGSWRLFPETNAALEGINSLWLKGALEIIGAHLQYLARLSDKFVSKGQMTLKGKIVSKKLFRGYKRNLPQMSALMSRLLRNAITFEASGLKYPRETISRHGPLVVTLWEPLT